MSRQPHQHEMGAPDLPSMPRPAVPTRGVFVDSQTQFPLPTALPVVGRRAAVLPWGGSHLAPSRSAAVLPGSALLGATFFLKASNDAGCKFPDRRPRVVASVALHDRHHEEVPFHASVEAVQERGSHVHRYR